MNGSRDMVSNGFAALPDLIAAHAQERPTARALVAEEDSLDYRALDRLVDQVAAGLQRDGCRPGDRIALVAETTPATVAFFLGALRAGAVPAPIAPSATPEQIATMVRDSGARLCLVDPPFAISPTIQTVTTDALDRWLPDADPVRVTLAPGDRFNILYSSGTTGQPKGIAHSHHLRWMQIRAFEAARFDQAVTMIATPLHSNTTLVSLIPTLAYGGCAVLLGKFDARRFLEVAERERATHAMLVPVQYQRIMALPDFDRFDLSHWQVKSCTGAPFDPALKAQIVARWPGMLIEIYGSTEGGATCVLYANAHPDKLHTVGTPSPGADIRLIDEQGREVPQGTIGEVVGRGPVMMEGYHGQAEATEAATWTDAAGRHFIRHGDLGRFDEDGFLTLLGRCKDMIISGGFNIYPSDIEAVLAQHPGVAEAAVVAMVSARWGETPYAFYVPHHAGVAAEDLLAWANARLGKTQRLAGAQAVADLPRSAIGKVLKRELRDRLADGDIR